MHFIVHILSPGKGSKFKDAALIPGRIYSLSSDRLLLLWSLRGASTCFGSSEQIRITTNKHGV